MFLSCLSIPLDSINFSTDWNLHPWEFRTIPTELQENLALNGIIHPPLVIADSEKTFTIVSGARRIEFVRRFIDSSQIDCLVIEKDTPYSFILNLILADQSCASDLSLAEKARFVQVACRFLKMEDILTNFRGSLQLKNGRSTITDLLKILQQDEEIIREIHAGRLQDRMVSELLSLPEESDRIALVQLFKNLCMGDGKQKRFFKLIRDIAFREGSSIASYLLKKEIAAIIGHKEMNIPQKIYHLGCLLQQESSPSSSIAEGNFVKQVKNLQLPENYSISHSPFFEKDEVTLSITFENFTACKQYLGQQQ
jgi:hypothetical protein